ncbi:hypothetical protein TNCV_4751941 [Trichonephila clavipes]|nr:hypothetical protein TNCV_4751941 [Trichonephila clavipes]
MPVVSAPCSCQPDCLVCGRGDVPPYDCAIHVLLESMVFKNECCTASPLKQDWRKFYRVERNIYLEPCKGRTKIAYVG